MQTALIKRLESLGLNQKEAAVYVALLTMKKGTALTIAERAGIKRPTAYLVLESLVQKKLITVTTFREVKDYRALPLGHLAKYIRRQKQCAERVLPAMTKLYNTRAVKLRLRVYQGAGAVKLLFEKSLREKAALKIIGSPEFFAELLGDFWPFYLKRAEQHALRPHFKPTPGPISVLLWSDKVAFIAHDESAQSFGFKNKPLHEVYLNLYKSL